MVLCLWVGISKRGRLYSGSVSIVCVYFGVSSVGLCRSLLRVVGGGRWSVGVVRFLSRMRWDLRVVMAGAGVWRVGGSHGRVVSVFLSSWMICVIQWSSSPVRVYRRLIWETWCACAWVWRRTGIVPL